MNEKLYIHEFIHIILHNRANYMHHMTANWSPIAQEERHQLCYGVWGTLGSTGRWPEVVNMWEEDGFDGMASSFGIETGHASLQDPKLAKWWAKAATFRSGGVDRLMVPAPWTRTIEELVADGVRGEVYAHEFVTVAPGAAADFLELVRAKAVDAYARYNIVLAGAFRTALIDDSECLLLWAIPTWQDWADLEKAHYSGALDDWKNARGAMTRTFQRTLLNDAPLSPFLIGRQPSRDDRTDWED
ncbi:MAG TPA: hypothetical protein VGL26_05980 [Jatrophihabitans sp.]